MSRRALESQADRVEIVRKRIPGHRLDHHPCAAVLQRPLDMSRCGLGIAHVVQAVEAGDQVEVAPVEVLRPADLEAQVQRLAALCLPVAFTMCFPCLSGPDAGAGPRG